MSQPVVEQSDVDEQEESTEEQDQAEDQESPTVAELQAEISRLRKEAASYRVKAREARKSATSKAASDTSGDDVKAAEERGREAARLEYGVRLAGAEVRASLAGVVPDDRIESVVNRINLSQYVDEEGEVDRDAVKELREEYVALLGKKSPAKVSHGRQGTAGARNDEREVVRSLFGR